MNPRRIFADLLVFGRGYMRNPIGLFFSLAFPVILIGLFGLIFSSTGSSAVTLYTQNLDHHSNESIQFLQALNATGAVKVKLVDPSVNLSSYLAANGDPVGLIIPGGFQSAYQNHTSVTLTIFTDPQDQYSTGVVLGATQGVMNGFNLRAVNGTPIIQAHSDVVGGRIYKYIDYLVPGLIGFSILTSPMFAMVDISASYRKDHLFRQLSLTPLTRGEWLTAKILWYILLSVISAVLMVVVGSIVFGAHVGLALDVLPFLFVGPFFFVSLGMLCGTVSRTPETAAVIANVITFPMMFLSGTFFPVSGFSPFLQGIAHALPLYYVIDGMNQVLLFNNTAIALRDLLLVFVGSVVVFIAAIYLFKWRDD